MKTELKTVQITLEIQYDTQGWRPDKWDWIDLLGFYDEKVGTVHVVKLKELD